MNYYEFLIGSKIETQEITAYSLWQILGKRVACVGCELCESFVAVLCGVSQCRASPTVTFGLCCGPLLNLPLIHAYVFVEF